MNEKTKQQHEIDLAKARAHMSVVAVGLTQKLGAVGAVGVLLGAAIGVLETHVGGTAGANLLRAAAHELEHGEEPEPPVAGRA